jgi:2-iminobutanoate/2-iminopropanoate deaminase
MHHIETDAAPRPGGHYSQGVVHNGTVYVSGQLPIDPRTGERRLDSIESQTRQALANVAAVLDAAGARLADVLKVTVYISDIELWDRVNRVYAEFFGDHRPARCVVSTRELHFGFQVEIEAVAALPFEGE